MFALFSRGQTRMLPFNASSAMQETPEKASGRSPKPKADMTNAFSPAN